MHRYTISSRQNSGWNSFRKKKKKREETKKERKGKIKIQRENIYTRSEKGINVRRVSVHSVTVIPLCSLTFRNVTRSKRFPVCQVGNNRSPSGQETTVQQSFQYPSSMLLTTGGQSSRGTEGWVREEGVKCKSYRGCSNRGGRVNAEGARRCTRGRKLRLISASDERPQPSNSYPRFGAFILAREDTGRAAINTLSI